MKDAPVERNIVLVGLQDIMFDRYPGDNDTKLEPWQKLYLDEEKTIGIPSLNIVSFYSAHNTNSAPKRLMDKRKFKDAANAYLSFLTIEPSFIPFKRNGVAIRFGVLENQKDAMSGVYIHSAVARLDKGIPNPKVRPVLPLPWELEFKLTIWPNKEFQEQQLINLFEAGGRALGLGTFRGVFGKFVVKKLGLGGAGQGKAWRGEARRGRARRGGARPGLARRGKGSTLVADFGLPLTNLDSRALKPRRVVAWASGPPGFVFCRRVGPAARSVDRASRWAG